MQYYQLLKYLNFFKFFSKRLNHAVVAFSTNFGYDKDLINRLASERYGFKFLIPNAELKQLMSEDYSNFQEFSAFEKHIDRIQVDRDNLLFFHNNSF